MTGSAAKKSSEKVGILKRHEVPIPAEGENGNYTQAWYAVAISDDVKPGQVIGSEFLGGRIAIYRTESGEPRVVSAYCPHMGARLDRGQVVGDTVQCPFHKFEFDGNGQCIRTGINTPPPPTARLFTFPVIERYGMIWAFNGEQPHWDLPNLAFPDEDLHFHIKLYAEVPADPHVICCNTPDYHHYRTVHGLEWSHPDPDPVKDFRWTDHSFQFDLDGYHWNKRPMKFTFGIYSTSLYFQQGTLGDKWYGFIAPFTVIRPNTTLTYFIIATHKGDKSPEAIAAAEVWAKEVMDLEFEFVNQDLPILDGIHFRQGTLTARDRPLVMYLDMVRRQPRGNPARDFIN